MSVEKESCFRCGASFIKYDYYYIVFWNNVNKKVNIANSEFMLTLPPVCHSTACKKNSLASHLTSPQVKVHIKSGVLSPASLDLPPCRVSFQL